MPNLLAFTLVPQAGLSSAEHFRILTVRPTVEERESLVGHLTTTIDNAVGLWVWKCAK